MEPRTPRKPMSQRKTRTSAVALLTVAGGLLATAPMLITPKVAAAAERVVGDPNQKTIGDPGLRAIGDPNTRVIGDPKTRLQKAPPPVGPDIRKNGLRPRGERGIILHRNKTKGERGFEVHYRQRHK